MSSSNIKLVLTSVLLSQVITFGAVFAYKGATGSVFPGFGYTQQELNSIVAGGMRQAEDSRKAQAAEALLQREILAEEKVPNDARVFGDLRARFTLIEFSDLECPFCKRLHPTLREVVSKSGGAVNWQWRHMPLSFHNPAAANGAHAAECYAEQKGNRGFWAFLSKWFEDSRMNGGGVADMDEFVSEMGADLNDFQQCMSSGKFKDRIQQQAAQGAKIGATGTPATVVVDNLTGEKEFIAGARNSQDYVQIMKRMIEKSEEKDAKDAAQQTPEAAEKAAQNPQPDAMGQAMGLLIPQSE